MSIISGYQKIKKMIKTTDGYQLLSHWTSSDTVEMNDGTTLEDRICNVDNTSDQDKPISTAQQNALDQKADIANPVLTGTPIAPTPPTGTNTAQIATTEFVQTAVNNATDGIITEIKSEDSYMICDRSGSAVTITHKDASQTDTSSTAKPSAGGTFTAVKSVSSDTKGHVTGIETETITLPSLDATGLGLVSTKASQGLNDTEQANARANIGAGTSSFSGSYNDLSNKPTALPANGGTANYLTPTLILASANLNAAAYQTPGFYYCPANATVTTLSNCPTKNAFFMIVGKHAGVYQEITEYVTNNPKRWMRNYYNNTWGSWYRVYTEADKPADTTYSNFVKSGSGAKAGLVPAPSTTAGTTKYLREDGSWAVPPDTNTTYAASTVTPKEAGTAAVGTSSKYAREDHIHPLPTTVVGYGKGTTTAMQQQISLNTSYRYLVISNGHASSTKAHTISLLYYTSNKWSQLDVKTCDDAPSGGPGISVSGNTLTIRYSKLTTDYAQEEYIVLKLK